MVPFELTPATVILGLVVLALVVVVVRRLMRRGTCDCAGRSDQASQGGCAGCSGCSKVDQIASDLKKL